MKYLVITLSLLISEMAYAQQTLYRYFDKKWGVTNEAKQIVIAPEYDEVELGLFPYIKVKKGDRTGLTDLKGKLFIPCEYYRIEIMSRRIARVENEAGNKVMSLPSGKLSPIFNVITGVFHGKAPLVIVKNASKLYGVYDPQKNKMVLDYQYYSADFLMDTITPLLKIYSRERKYGLVDGLTGKEIIPMGFDDIEEFWENGKPVIKTTAQGTVAYYDIQGKSREVKDPDLLGSTPDANLNNLGLAVIEPDRPTQFESTGQDTWNIWQLGSADHKIELTGFSSLKCLVGSEWLLLAKKNGKAGILDCFGRTRLPFIYDSIILVKRDYSHYSTRYYAAIQNGLQVLVDGFDMQPINKPIFTDIKLREETVGIAPPNGRKVSIYNSSDLAILMAEVTMPDGKKGFMDLITGKVYIPGVE